jgi:hypothetical protein
MGLLRNDGMNRLLFVVPRRGVAPYQGDGYRRWDEATTEPGRRLAAGRCMWMHRGTGEPCKRPVVTNDEGTYLPFCASHVGRYTVTKRYMEGVLTGVSKRARHGAYSEIIRAQVEAAFERNGDPTLRREILADMQVMAAANPDDAAQVIKGVLLKLIALQERCLRRFVAGEISLDDYTAGMLKFAEETRKLALAKHTISGTQQDEQEEAIELALDELGLNEEPPLGDVDFVEEDLDGVKTVGSTTNFPQVDDGNAEAEEDEDGIAEPVELRP